MKKWVLKLRNDKEFMHRNSSQRFEICHLERTRMSFDITRQMCHLMSEELTGDQLIDNYYCRNCGYTIDEHMRKKFSRDFE